MSNAVKEQTSTVKPGQDIVASMVKDFRVELLSHVKDGVKNLVIDLENVDMIDSVGLGVFVAANNSLSENDGKLSVCNVSKELLSLFKSMRLDQHFAVTDRN